MRYLSYTECHLTSQEYCVHGSWQTECPISSRLEAALYYSCTRQIMQLFTLSALHWLYPCNKVIGKIIKHCTTSMIWYWHGGVIWQDMIIYESSVHQSSFDLQRIQSLRCWVLSWERRWENSLFASFHLSRNDGLLLFTCSCILSWKPLALALRTSLHGHRRGGKQPRSLKVRERKPHCYNCRCKLEFANVWWHSTDSNAQFKDRPKVTQPVVSHEGYVYCSWSCALG